MKTEKDELWKRFEKSGRVDDYLAYRGNTPPLTQVPKDNSDAYND